MNPPSSSWDPFEQQDEQPSRLCLHRVRKEIVDFVAHQPPRMFICPVENDMTGIDVLMLGAPDSPYEGGAFQFFLKCPPDYPLSAPRVRFLNTDEGRVRFHPRLCATGKVCLRTLGTLGGPGWNPMLSLRGTLASIQCLLGAHPLHAFKWQAKPREAALYDVFVQHETIRLYRKYENTVKARLHETGWQLWDPVGFKHTTAQYETLLTRLQALRDKVEEKKKAEGGRDRLRGSCGRGLTLELVDVLGNVSLPDNVSKILGKGPKYSFDPGAQRHQLLGMTRRAATCTSFQDRERATSDAVSCVISKAGIGSTKKPPLRGQLSTENKKESAIEQQLVSSIQFLGTERRRRRQRPSSRTRSCRAHRRQHRGGSCLSSRTATYTTSERARRDMRASERPGFDIAGRCGALYTMRGDASVNYACGGVTSGPFSCHAMDFDAPPLPLARLVIR
ncbi:hypothetical protein MTO96_016455 [Rhipicephalus appendiculatus]